MKTKTGKIIIEELLEYIKIEPRSYKTLMRIFYRDITVDDLELYIRTLMTADLIEEYVDEKGLRHFKSSALSRKMAGIA